MAHQPSKSSDIATEWPETPQKNSEPISFSPSSSVSAGANDTPALPDLEEWDTTTCLFCPISSSDFSTNLAHMTSVHSLSIPSAEELIVDLQTLLSYCHLVVFGYGECLMCGAQRGGVKALQAHMRDKRHCRFSVEDEESDFRAFYGVREGDEGEGVQEGEGIEDVDVDGQLRLPSGKVLGNRDYRSPRPVRSSSTERETLQDSFNPTSSSQPSATSASPTSPLGTPSTALSRADRRSLTASKQLSYLSAADRMQLAHLPASEQRALLATQKKQLEKKKRASQWMEGRLQGKANRTAQGNYRVDGAIHGAGRLNG